MVEGGGGVELTAIPNPHPSAPPERPLAESREKNEPTATCGRVQELLQPDRALLYNFIVT